MAWTPYYKPHFYRHLNHLVINGFYARSLDADDHAFIESVKVKGIANGDEPSSSAVLIEELGFWHFPYTIEPGVERKVGSRAIRRPVTPETPEQREQRKARSSRWRAQREIRKQEREIAAIELAREQREHEAAKQRRTVREIITDAEWDAAAPKHAPFGATIDGKHVPEWKLQELGIAAEPHRQPGLTKRQRRTASERRAELVREAIEARRRKAEKDRARKRLIEEDRLRSDAKKTHDRSAVKEQARREKILAEARDNLIRIELLERQWKETANPYPDRASLMQAVVTLLNRTPGYAWSGKEMMRSLGCTDVNLMNEAIDELVRTGRLKTGTPQ